GQRKGTLAGDAERSVRVQGKECPVSERNYTPYQQKVIRDYYRNQDDNMVRKLGEMISDLYLSEGKKRKQIWTRIAAALRNLKYPEERIHYLVSRDDPTLLARLYEELLGKE
ncbi:MAG: hypothetical protein Q4C47_09730, partial [Planctomycetia bacterium]|nr:hypothetical protein [Planctomycetia bacterium]